MRCSHVIEDRKRYFQTINSIEAMIGKENKALSSSSSWCEGNKALSSSSSWFYCNHAWWVDFPLNSNGCSMRRWYKVSCSRFVDSLFHSSFRRVCAYIIHIVPEIKYITIIMFHIQIYLFLIIKYCCSSLHMNRVLSRILAIVWAVTETLRFFHCSVVLHFDILGLSLFLRMLCFTSDVIVDTLSCSMVVIQLCNVDIFSCMYQAQCLYSVIHVDGYRQWTYYNLDTCFY